MPLSRTVKGISNNHETGKKVHKKQMNSHRKAVNNYIKKNPDKIKFWNNWRARLRKGTCIKCQKSIPEIKRTWNLSTKSGIIEVCSKCKNIEIRNRRFIIKK